MVELSREEMMALFDGMTRRQLGISGQEFLQRLDEGSLPDSPVVEYLASMAGVSRAG